MLVLGTRLIISMNMILFTLSLFRLYVCFNLMKYWSLYTNPKAERIIKMFKNRNGILYLYKSNIKKNGFLTLGLILCIILYISSLIFKVYEHYSMNQVDGFIYIWNCFWFIIVTMTTSI